MEILAVIVRYQVALEDSTTFVTLERALQNEPMHRDVVGVLIWDNSPQPIADARLPARFEYQHSPSNPGVSGAYNGAARIARERGAKWILLLDQDTALPCNYISTMLAQSRAVASSPGIAAIVPVVKVGDRVVSPRVSVFNGHREYTESDAHSSEVFAINSGCLLRLSALEAIGGFSHEFWLDYSDRYVFHQFHLRGLRVLRADVELQHEMTILDYDRLMSPSRYQNFIEAEGAFNDLYKGRIENAVQTLRLIVRAVRQRIRYKNPRFSHITFRQLVNRVTKSRKRRLDLWTATQRARQAAQ